MDVHYTEFPINLQNTNQTDATKYLMADHNQSAKLLNNRPDIIRKRTKSEIQQPGVINSKWHFKLDEYEP